MQLKTIVLAAPALGKLSAGDLELRIAYKLKNLVSMLQKDVDFFIEQRQKIFEKYGTAQKDGTFTFDNDAEKKASLELEALLDMEVEAEYQTLEIPVTEDLRLSVHDIDALTPFICFTE